MSYGTRDGSAKSLDQTPFTHDKDYAATSGTLTFAPGVTSKNIEVTINGDIYAESEEQFAVSLSSPVNAVIEDGVGTVTIQDGSRLPVILLEGVAPDDRVNEGFGFISVAFTLNHPDEIGIITSGRETTLDYTVTAFTPPENSNVRQAILGSDYYLRPASGTISFLPGENIARLTINILDDELEEPIERFMIRFDNPSNATFPRDADHLFTIIDNDPDPRIDVHDSRVREALGPMRFDVILANVSARDVSFDYNTQMGTAFEVEDYSYTQGRVIIPASATTATIEVPIINDEEPEYIEEKFTLFLRNAEHGVLVNTEPVGYIIDDDQALQTGLQTKIVVSSADVVVAEGSSTGTSIDVRLSSAPTGSVAVTVSGTANTDLTAAPSSLTFDTSTWETDQTVTFTDASDLDAEDESHVIQLSASGGGYAGVGRAIQVTVEDDDTAGISVSHTSLTIDETGHGSFTVTLDTEPVDTVHTTITKSASQLVDLASVRLEQTALSFTAADWQTHKMVTVHAHDDEDAINEHFELHLSGSGAGYAGLRTSVTVTVSDDDSPALVLADSEGNDLGSTPAIAMMERDSTSIKVALGTEPSAAVNVELTVARPAELTVDTDQTPGTVTLSFEVTDWHVPQRIQLTSLGDVDSAQEPAIPVAFSVTGGDYDNLTVPDLSVTITESDALGLVFSSDAIEVYEGDTTPATYTVRLGRQPLENPGGVDSVTVAISPSAGSGLTVMPTSLTFIRRNWDNPQTVSVTVASDDDVDDATATLTNSTSGATEYAGISADVAVSIVDDDEQALVITPSPLSVNEGAMASYGVQLATRPTGEVVVVVSGHSGSDFSLDTTSLTFTISNWNVAQNVQVSAAQDDDAESDAVTLMHTASGSDYGGVTANVAVNTVENEQEALTVSQTIISLAEGANATFSVALASRPSTSVTVNLSAPQGSGLTFDKASLTFSTGDWQTAQTVTITSSHDNDAANESVDVRLEVGSGAYGADAVVLQVAVIDDDAVGILLSDESLNVVEGVTTSYTVRLATQPSETVTVDIGLSVGADISVSTRQIAFNPNNWMSERTVTVVTRRDLDADVAPAITVTHTASNGDYDMVTKALTVTVSEVDVRGLVFLDSDGGTVGVSESLDIDEGDSTSYSARLATQPSAQVVVTLSPGVGLSLNKTSLTFTSSDWIRAQTVTVTGSDDEDTSDGAAAIAHTIAGGGYDSVARSLEFVITDDDTAAILLTDSSGAALATDGLTVTEGATASYRVQLATQPSATVTVAISGTANTDLTTDETSLTFTGMNWNTPQTVEVRAGHDDDAITGAKATLSHAATGGEYESVTADLAVVIAEDDSDGFVVTDAAGDPLGGDTLTVDEGNSAAYKISLSAEPAGTVTVTLSGTGNTDLQLDKTELTFTATTWGTPQTVTATAARDDDVLDDRVILTHTPSGAGYAAPALSLNVVITDDDHQSVVLSVISLEIQERDTAIVGVSLGSVPTADVVVDLALSMSADLELPRTELTFTPQNWMTAQNVSVVSQHDDDGRDDDAQISFNANGGDYTSVLSILPVIIRDVDVPGIVLNLDALEVMEGLSADFTVELATEPSETVTVTISGSSGTNLALSSTRLVFTSMDWSTRQTVTATAAHDNDIADEMIELNLTAEGGDYDPVTKSLTVTVNDDDPAVEVSFAQGSYSVDEGLSVSVTVSLSEAPGRTVVIPLTHTPQGNTTSADYSGVPANVTFSTGDMSQTITFTATQDDVDDGGKSVLLGFGTTLPGGVSLGTTTTTTVNITDDDTAGVSVSEAALTIAEGSSDTYTIVLDSQPTAAVTVTINDPSNTDVTAEPASLTFSSTDWSTPKTVTVNAARDADAEGETATVTHTVTSTDSSYSAASANSVSVIVTDDDTAGVSVSEAELTIAEGSSDTYTIVLDSQPTAAVTVTINDPSNTDVTAEPASLTFSSTDWSSPKTVTVNAARDADAEGETATVTHTVTSTDSSYSAASANSVAVTITDDDPQQGDLGGNVGRRGTVVTIERVPDGTVIPDNSSLAVGVTVVGNSTFMEGTQALFRLKFEAVGGGPPVGDGVDVDLRFSWHIPSPLVTAHGYATQGTWSLHRVDVWDTAVPIHDNDFGHPDGTVTIRIIGCERSGCIIGTPSVLTVTIADDDGGPAAAVPGPPGVPRLVCARSGDGYDDTGIAVSWKAPNFVGGAPVESYELRYRESSRFVGGTLIEHPWESWRHGVAATSATLTGLVPRANYTVQVRAVSANGPGLWSEPWYFRVGPTDEVCEIIDQLTPQPLNPPRPASAQQSLSNTPAEGEPRIDGIPELGQTLSADTTAIADADGLENVVFQYQWLAEDADIPGATGATYTVVSGDVGKAIKVRVTFTDDAGQEETLTSVPIVVTAAGLQIQSATVDGATLTLTYSEVLDTGVTLGTAAFAVNVNGSSRSLIAVGVGQSNVLLLLSSAVEAGDTVTVDYTAPDGPDFIRDIRGRKAASFSGQSVTNDTASPPLTASAHDAPSSHNGQDAFTFELRFSEDPEPDFSYTTVRDHAFTVTGGSVTYVRRLEPGKNVRWETTVSPGYGAAITIALNATTDCSAQGAICTEEGGKLSGGLQFTVPGPLTPVLGTPNTPATGLPTITGTAQVGGSLTADTTGISDDDGLDSAIFSYQWLAADAEINGANASTYTLADADAGKTIKVQVSFTDDAGNDEQLTSVVTGAVAAAPPPPNTPATGAPTISGVAQVGETLTAATTGISDGDGLGNATFAYQWLADNAEIDSTTASSYTLVAADAGKAIKVRVSFTDDEGNDEHLTSAMTGAVAAAPPPPNTPANGSPTVTGTAQVGETLTTNTTGISDDDGLDNATFAYQWLADDAEIDSATASSYTLVAADAGKAIKVRVSFADDGGNDEELTSAATGEVAAAEVAAAVVNPPLTATTHDVPSSHNGQNAFTFEMRFSEAPRPDFSYTTVRDHAFTVAGGSVTYVRRLEPGKNIRWEITVTPDSSADVAIALNATTDCEANSAICTEDGRMLSAPLELTVNGPGQ